jgi:hypothetical protein
MAMLYEKEKKDNDWKTLQRKWARPAIIDYFIKSKLGKTNNARNI